MKRLVLAHVWPDELSDDVLLIAVGVSHRLESKERESADQRRQGSTRLGDCAQRIEDRINRGGIIHVRQSPQG